MGTVAFRRCQLIVARVARLAHQQALRETTVGSEVEAGQGMGWGLRGQVARVEEAEAASLEEEGEVARVEEVAAEPQ